MAETSIQPVLDQSPTCKLRTRFYGHGAEVSLAFILPTLEPRNFRRNTRLALSG